MQAEGQVDSRTPSLAPHHHQAQEAGAVQLLLEVNPIVRALLRLGKSIPVPAAAAAVSMETPLIILEALAVLE